jgi:hypothetical protein
MRIIFDQGTPVPLRRFLPGHEVSTAYELGWSRLINGELLDRAEQEGCTVFVTTDSNLRHQQNLAIREISIVALTTTSMARWIRGQLVVVRAIDDAIGRSYTEVQIP